MAVMAGLLIFIGAFAGTWVWVAKHRCTWEPWVAHLAGAFAGLIVSLLVLDLFTNAVGQPIKGLAGGLVTLMFSAGAWIGVWYWLATRSRPAFPWLRHVLGAACGFLAGTFMLLRCIAIFTAL